MDESKIEVLGIEPIQAQIDEVRNIKDKSELTLALGRMRKLGVGGPIGFFVDQDDKDATRYLSNIMQSGSTLPDRDYYLKDDERSRRAKGARRLYSSPTQSQWAERR